MRSGKKWEYFYEEEIAVPLETYIGKAVYYMDVDGILVVDKLTYHDNAVTLEAYTYLRCKQF